MKPRHTRMIAYLGMISLLASLIVGLLGFSTSTREVDTIKEALLRRHVINNIHLTMRYIINSYGTLTAGDGTLLDQNGNSIEGAHGVVDAVLEDLGDRATIFVKENNDFKRISTNVISEHERAVDTWLGKDHNAYETVMNGSIYVGEADILGENYYTAYDPIKDQNNNVIGLLFVGMPTWQLDRLVETHDETMDRIDITIIILRTISLGALIILVTGSLLDQRKPKDDEDTKPAPRTPARK